MFVIKFKSKIYKYSSLLIISLYITYGCSTVVEKQTCMNDREKMGLKGPVKKIETVSITTTPLGEMVTFYPEEKSKVKCIDGDVMVVFTENGDIDSFHIYGQENKELFAAVKDGREKEKTPIIIPEPSFYQEMNQMSCVCYYDSLQRPISIIDPETTEEIKPVLYFDEKTNEVKGKCKLKPYKSYFAFEIRENNQEEE